MQKLSEIEVSSALKQLPEWRVVDSKLQREFRFADFVEAVGFMMMAAPGIEKMNHHPEWFNVYGTVRVDLTSHDAGGITERDLRLARLLDETARKLIK